MLPGEGTGTVLVGLEVLHALVGGGGRGEGRAHARESVLRE